MNDRHIIIGAGPVGRQVARQLAERGSKVVVVTRSGTDTGIPGIEHVAADASDAEALIGITGSASVLYNCANPGDYTQWLKVWPPLAKSLEKTAEKTGAILATTGNLYPYGPVDGPMTEGMPDLATDRKGQLRATMWADAKKLHEDGRIRALEVRASDFVGPHIGPNGHLSRVLPAATKGRTVRVMGSPDQPHSWTDVQDVARALVAAAADESAHGRIWHAPTNAPRTQREALHDVLEAGGHDPVAVKAYPRTMLALGGKVMPVVRELNELRYQFDRPYVLDSSETQERFNVAPTPWEEVCRRTLNQ